jgi:putative transcriptional regulator
MARHYPPRHHPSDELLLAYAAGSCAETVSLVVATHLALCPDCRAEVAQLEALGGALLEELAPTPLPAGLLQQVMSRIDDPAEALAEPGPDEGSTRADNEQLLPRPLRDYVGGPLDKLSWRRLGPLSVVELVGGAAGASTQLMRIRPDTIIPRHSHPGLELVLVLAGAMSDERGTYQRGDISEADASLVHEQVTAAGEDCICLVASGGALELPALIERPAKPRPRPQPARRPPAS